MSLDDAFLPSTNDYLDPEVRRKRGMDALAGFRPTAKTQLAADRHEAKERRRAAGKPATPVDLLRKSLDLLERDGWYTERLEWYDAVHKRRHDLFGCVDAIALKNGWPMLAVQATSWSNVSARVEKMKASRGLALWLACGGIAVVHGWRKAANGRYEYKEVRIDGETLHN